MATPIGTNTVTAISRRYIEPQIADQVYASNPLFFRLCRSNRKMIQGGTQIEFPLMYSRWANGGFYSGFDVLNVAPSDTVQNAAWDWKQAYVAVTVDGRTMLRTDSPEAIADFLRVQFGQAHMELSEILGASLWGFNSTGSTQLDGIVGAVDNSTLVGTYGGITRSSSSNTWWNSFIDTAAAGASTLAAHQSNFSKVTIGGRHPTLIASNQTVYNGYWNLIQTGGGAGTVGFPTILVSAGGQDEVMAQAGFNNLLFNNVPFVVDSHITSASGAYSTTNTGVCYYLNEDFLYLVVSPRADFKVEDFQTPFNQDAMVAKVLWYGNVVCNNTQVQAKNTWFNS
jgi:hypothetical protein